MTINHTVQTVESNRISNDAQTGLFTFLAIVVCMGLSAGAIAGATVHPIWFSLAAGSFGGAVMLVWRVSEHDRRAMTSRRTTEETAESEGGTIRAMVGNGENGRKHVRLGRYKLTYRDWHRLARTLLQNDGKFVRDVVSSANVFKSITKNWSDILAEFERLEMVEGGKLTGKGFNWFNKFIMPVAPPSPIGFDYTEDF